jgi:hypothetical protein
VDALPKKEKAPLLLDDHHFKVSKVNDYGKSPFCIRKCVSNIFLRAEIVSLVHLLVTVLRPRTDLIETGCKIPILNLMRPIQILFGSLDFKTYITYEPKLLVTCSVSLK